MMKKILGVVFVAALFFTASSAFSPINVGASELMHDDGEFCPDAGGNCVVLGGPTKPGGN